MSGADFGSGVPVPDDSGLVEAIRRVALAAHSRTLGAPDRHRVLEHLAAAERLLTGGEPRRRWYEASADEARTSNRQLSAWSGALNPVAPPMVITDSVRPDGRSSVVGAVRLDRLREGPPRSVHGGVLAGLFDEILGAGQRLAVNGPGGMTVHLRIRYRRPTPIDEDLEFSAWIHDERSRRIAVRAECRVVGPGGRITAEAEALFLRVDFAAIEAELRPGRCGEGGRPEPGPA